jgi:hypothetical protein
MPSATAVPPIKIMDLQIKRENPIPDFPFFGATVEATVPI